MTELKSLRLLPEILKLKEILVPATRIYEYDETEGHCISVDDLSSNPFKFESVPDDFALQPLNKSYAKLTQSALLVSLADGLKFLLCTATVDNPIFVEGDVLAFSIVRDDIHLGYLIYHLTLKNVNDEKELFNQQIEFPSFKKDELSNRYKAYKKDAINKLGLQDVIDDEIAEFIKKVRLRKHDMRSVFLQLNSIEKRIRRYINDDTLSEAERNRMISERLDSYNKAMTRLDELMELLPKEEEFGNPELINLDNFLYNYHLKFDEDEEWFTLDYDCLYQSLSDAGISVPSYPFTSKFSLDDLKDVNHDTYRPADAYVMISENDLRIALDCIIDNAIKHGLSDRTDCDGIFIYLRVDSTHKNFQIDIINDGKPLPKGMTKERYGIKGEKAGQSGNTGLGGYRVKSIVEHYKGDYDIFSEYVKDFDCYRTIVRIYLPIAKV